MLKTLLQVAATRRGTRLIMEDKITEPVRDYIHTSTPPNSKLSYLITCPWCTSIWVAAILAATQNTSTGKFLTTTLALSELSTLSQNYLPDHPSML